MMSNPSVNVRYAASWVLRKIIEVIPLYIFFTAPKFKEYFTVLLN